MAFAFTTTEWILVGLVLVLGWILGLLSSSGGKKWKARLEEERQAHAATRAAHAETLQAEQNRTRALESRNRELEAKLREREQATPSATSVAPATAASAGTTAAFATSHASSDNSTAAVAGDDLSLIKGIGPDGRDRLSSEGLASYRDIEAMDDARATEIERRHGLDDGTIEREEWREQARLLREGRTDEHRRRFG